LKETGANWLLRETSDPDMLALDYVIIVNDKKELNYVDNKNNKKEIASVFLYLTSEGWKSEWDADTQEDDSQNEKNSTEIMPLSNNALNLVAPSKANLEACIIEILYRLSNDGKITWRCDTNVWLCPEDDEKTKDTRFSEYAFSKAKNKINEIKKTFEFDS